MGFKDAVILILLFFPPSFLTDTVLISYDKLFCGLPQNIYSTAPKYLFDKYRRKKKGKAAPAMLILEKSSS